jgi:NTP pyrophosphatase (non-canonical NTP hydrolase)
MNLNELCYDIHGVMEAKGFHGIQHTHLETITFRQLLHLVTEWDEMHDHFTFLGISDVDQGQNLADLYEEGADILIVALDLCGMHGIDLSDVRIEDTPIGILDLMYERVPKLIGKLGDHYRKERSLRADLMEQLIITVSHILRRHGADPIAEIEKKMARNRNRPQRYGTAEVE